MNTVDQFYAALIYIWSEVTAYKHILLGVVITMTISVLKAARDGKPQNWGENLLCGIFSGIACSGLTIMSWLIQKVFNIPTGMEIPAIFVVGVISAFIGMIGTVRIVEYLRNKTGVNDVTNKGEF